MEQQLPLYNTTKLSIRTNKLIKLEFILMWLLCIMSAIRYIAALNGIEFGTDENISYSWDSIDIAYWVAASACLLVIIFSNIISMRWRYLAYRNTYRLSSKWYTCTPKWMIWWWIVPFVLLNIPIDIMKQFSRRISKEINQDIISIGLIKFRWILVVIDALLQRWLDLSTDTTQQVIKSWLIEVAILLISMLAIYITLIFYKKITAQEQEWLAFKLNSLKQ